MNYTQWGMMMSLCGGLYPLLGKVAHKVWNMDQYGDSAPAKQQESMITVGSEFKEALDNAKPIPDISEIKKKLLERDALLKYGEKDCELKCVLTEEQRQALRKNSFSWHWTGLTDPAFSKMTREDYENELKNVGNKGLDKAKAAIGR